MYTLGIKASLGKRAFIQYWGNHNPGACLLRDGEIIAAVEEERFTREKQAVDTFPYNSIRYVLEAEDLALGDVDTLSIGHDPISKWRDKKRLLPTSGSPEELYRKGREFGAYLAARRGIPKRTITRLIEEEFNESLSAETFTIPHHRGHAASAAYCADTDRPLTITVDNKGESDSTVIWDENLDRITSFPDTNSIGSMYHNGTKFLGYRGGKDSGKVMGLASYGEYREEFADAFDKLVSYGGGEYDVTPIVNDGDPIETFEEYFGDQRTYPDPFTQRHKDFAFHLQLKTEEILIHLVEYYVKNTGVSDIALAGGVFMNCKVNRLIKNLDCVDSIFVQPAANDSGICMGAALEGHRMATGKRPSPNFNHVYYGPEYDSAYVEQLLDNSKLEYEKTDTTEAVAKLLAEGKLVGWYQGRMEFGARALGNRSILANPCHSDSVDRVNKFVKNREPWRPFAPSLKFEAKEEYLVDGDESPYMILLDEVKEEKKEEVPSIVHVDGTTRPQTVRREVNEKYYDLITSFEELTGTPVLLNTSFNVAGEPIVESPEQAIQDFYSTGLDALALGDYLLTKE